MDAALPEVPGAKQVEDLLLDVRRYAALQILRAGHGVDERRLAVLLIGSLPLTRRQTAVKIGV